MVHRHAKCQRQQFSTADDTSALGYDLAWSPNGARLAYTLNIYTNLPNMMKKPPHTDNLSERLEALKTFHRELQETIQSMQPMRIVHQLRFVNADGSSDQCLRDVNARQFGWSPDGEQLFYLNDQNELHFIDFNGANDRLFAVVDTLTYPGGFSPYRSRFLLANFTERKTLGIHVYPDTTVAVHAPLSSDEVPITALVLKRAALDHAAPARIRTKRQSPRCRFSMSAERRIAISVASSA